MFIDPRGLFGLAICGLAISCLAATKPQPAASPAAGIAARPCESVSVEPTTRLTLGKS
jgi:hypothetical protein